MKSKAASDLADAIEAAAASAPLGPIDAPVVVEEPPAGLTLQERRIWYAERQVGSVRLALASAEATNNLQRLGSLNEQLRAWLNELGKLQPAAPVDPDAERRRWEQDAASVVAKIRAGIAAEKAAA